MFSPEWDDISVNQQQEFENYIKTDEICVEGFS